MSPEQNNDATPKEENGAASAAETTSTDTTSNSNFTGDAASTAPVDGKNPNADDDDDDDEEEKKIIPANPVPGSIGSSLSYSENAPNNSEKVPKEPFRWTKKRIMIASISGGVGALLLIILVVVLVLVNRKPEEIKNENTRPVSVETKEIRCERANYQQILTNYTFTSDDIRIEPSSSKENFIASYEDDQFYDVAYTLSVTYEDSNSAINAITVAKDSFNDALKKKKIEENPFTSHFSSNNNVLMVSHYSPAEKIDVNNAEIMGIGTTKGEVATDINQINSKFVSKGYTCTTETRE